MKSLFRQVLFALLLCSGGSAAVVDTLFNFTFGPSRPQGSLALASDGFLYGTAPFGGGSATTGNAGSGCVFRMSKAGVLSIFYSFDGGTNGGSPLGGAIVGNDGNLYGTTSSGGFANNGVIYKLSTGGAFMLLARFGGTNGATPYSSLVQANDGNFYGTTFYGGTNNNYGTIFRCTPGGALTMLVSFAQTNGANPKGGLMQASDGFLYGTTSAGGTYNRGTIFRMNLSGTMTVLQMLDGTNGAAPYGEMLQAADGTIYGAIASGLNGDVSGAGVLYRIRNGTFTPLLNFSTIGLAAPYGRLVQMPDGTILGNAYGGGSGYGGVFRYQTNSGVGVLTAWNSFDGVVAANPFSSGLISGNDGYCYGASYNGGRAGAGSVFRVNSTSNTVTLVGSLSSPQGVTPQAGLTMGADGNFYGTTWGGGDYDYGTLFKVTHAGAITTLYHFNNTVTNGANPSCQLLLAKDGNFYGTTYKGGSNFVGAIFRMQPNGTVSNIFSFGSTFGSYPLGGLIQGPDNALYGTCSTGPFPGNIFRCTTNGAYSVIAWFQTTNGSSPFNNLTFGPDGALYGSTQAGGTNGGNGTIFRCTTNGILTTLVHIAYTNAYNPNGGLVFGPDGALYGTSLYGGQWNAGTIFRCTTNGQLTVLVSLDFGVIGACDGPLVIGSDNWFYGVSSSGGSNGFGNVFKISTNGSYSLLAPMPVAAGRKMKGPLAWGYDGSLYGLTSVNGSGGGGSVFRLHAADRITQIQRVGNSTSVTLAGSAMTTYRLEATTNLASSVWTSVATNTTDLSGAALLFDAAAGSSAQRFYRTVTP